MTNDASLDAQLEEKLRALFDFQSTISKTILRSVSAGPAIKATIFLDNRQNLFVLIEPRSKTLLSDIRRIISRMGLRPFAYVPPAGRRNYFDDIAREKFLRVFPARRNIRSEELSYYRTLVPYSPALVHIAEVKSDVIKTYDVDTRGHWRSTLKFSYKKPPTKSPTNRIQ